MSTALSLLSSPFRAVFLNLSGPSPPCLTQAASHNRPLYILNHHPKMIVTIIYSSMLVKNSSSSLHLKFLPIGLKFLLLDLKIIFLLYSFFRLENLFFSMGLKFLPVDLKFLLLDLKIFPLDLKFLTSDLKFLFIDFKSLPLET